MNKVSLWYEHFLISPIIIVSITKNTVLFSGTGEIYIGILSILAHSKFF